MAPLVAYFFAFKVSLAITKKEIIKFVHKMAECIAILLCQNLTSVFGSPLGSRDLDFVKGHQYFTLFMKCFNHISVMFTLQLFEYF